MLLSYQPRVLRQKATVNKSTHVCQPHGTLATNNDKNKLIKVCFNQTEKSTVQSTMIIHE